MMDIIRRQYKKNIQQQSQQGSPPSYYRRRQQPNANEPSVYQLGTARASRDVPFFGTSDYRITTSQRTDDTQAIGASGYHQGDKVVTAQKKDFDDDTQSTEISTQRDQRRDGALSHTIKKHMTFTVWSFGAVAIVIMIIVSSLLFVGDVFAIRDRVTASGDEVIRSAKMAIAHAKISDMERVREDVHHSRITLEHAQQNLNEIHRFVVWVSRYIPGASQLATGDALITTATALTQGTEELLLFSQELRETIVAKTHAKPNILTILTQGFRVLENAQTSFLQAEKALAIVRLDDVPEKGRQHIIFLQKALPEIIDQINDVLAMRDTFENALGSNGMRTYLFLFQNNQEMRPTGGFIGSYGLLDIDHGVVDSFFIDGIYNPDGQLQDHIVPPKPLQKISANWSLHDSNWWPDFPTSAEVAIDFYERTGGKTPDGVIAITPTMIEKFLRITGPITMDAYGVTLDAENFIEKTQQKVEVDYDKEENRPKKILADFMPQLSQELLRDVTPQKAWRIVHAIAEGLREKHIILYARDAHMQQFILSHGWGGAMLSPEGDYLSVINTNINGFKTDGVIDQRIVHKSEIQSDGRIIDTVTITREHRGGHTGFPWWDAVNADYMRVYVPKGARLISAQGYTWEANDERLAYDALGFTRHPLVEEEENALRVDQETGTRIYTTGARTAFGNWVYVSPQEKVQVTYVYELPWRITFTHDNSTNRAIASHGVTFQKQAGETQTVLESTITLPSQDQILWATEKTSQDQNKTQSFMQAPLQHDLYHGIVFAQDN